MRTDTELATRLRLVLARSARRLRQESDTGLSPSLTAALATVERHGPLTPSELAARERVQRPTVTRLVFRLEEAGLIARAAGRTRKDAFLSERLDALGADDRATLERAAALLEGMLE